MDSKSLVHERLGLIQFDEVKMDEACLFLNGMKLKCEQSNVFTLISFCGGGEGFKG